MRGVARRHSVCRKSTTASISLGVKIRLRPNGGITVSGKTIAFDRLSISDYDGNSAKWDEIRWGTTFDSVTTTPVPEPSALALGGLGAAAMLIFRRRTQA